MSETVKIKLAEPEDVAVILNFLRQAATESDAITIPHLESCLLYTSPSPRD